MNLYYEFTLNDFFLRSMIFVPKIRMQMIIFISSSTDKITIRRHALTSMYMRECNCYHHRFKER
jgi:hypothetical protein